MTTIRTSKHLQVQQFKVLSHWIVILFFTLVSALSISCTKDKDEEVNPQERTLFLGTYKVTDKNNNNGEGTWQSQLKIEVSSKGADKVELKGFRYVNNGVYAKIKGNKMYISQVLEDSNEKVEINGEGTLEGNTLTYSYVLKHKEKGKQEKIYENAATATRL